MPIMLKCRKNFANLLLLSVMLFMLGVSACPAGNGTLPGDFLTHPEKSGEVKWINYSGAIVYRGQQVEAVIGEDFVWKPVDLLENLYAYSTDGTFRVAQQQCICICITARHSSRAPPAAAVNAFTV